MTKPQAVWYNSYMSEIPERVQRHLTPDQESSVEDLADKRGISIDMAERAILGERIEPTEPIAAPKTRRPHYSHRGGRPYPEVSGRDIGRMLANAESAEQPEVPLEERLAISARGRAAVEEALDTAFGKDRKLEAIRRKVEEMIPIRPDYVAEDTAARERLETALVTKYFEDKTGI